MAGGSACRVSTGTVGQAALRLQVRPPRSGARRGGQGSQAGEAQDHPLPHEALRPQPRHHVQEEVAPSRQGKGPLAVGPHSKE
eukprot:3875340-Pyramimonas_sp.AAC.1